MLKKIVFIIKIYEAFLLVEAFLLSVPDQTLYEKKQGQCFNNLNITQP